jgi:hypothetical protein
MSIYLSISLVANVLSIYLLVYLSVCHVADVLSVYLFVYLSVGLSV